MLKKAYLDEQSSHNQLKVRVAVIIEPFMFDKAKDYDFASSDDSGISTASVNTWEKLSFCCYKLRECIKIEKSLQTSPINQIQLMLWLNCLYHTQSPNWLDLSTGILLYLTSLQYMPLFINCTFGAASS